jgi:enterochelin esterase-like enzyme
MARFRFSSAVRSRFLIAGAVTLGCAFIAVGFVGIDRYGRNYWLYRGFPPPKDPAYVKIPGTQERISVTSAALGGRSQDVYVYLPPGYESSPNRRYPVVYLLHGFPGRPLAFLLTVRMGVIEDEVVTKKVARPVILVMPFGSTGTFTDKEWVDGIAPGEGWGTFVARDLVQAIDARYRTIASPAGRAIAGLSEGGYGAINIALHHPGEFRVVESWSGYVRAAGVNAIFGQDAVKMAANTPLQLLPKVAAKLRRAHTFFWFYSGADDREDGGQNRAFAAELKRLRIQHMFLQPEGGHNWALWRGQAQEALLAASGRLGRG